MTCTCRHNLHTNAKKKASPKARRIDPTRTVMLRRRYEGAMMRRFTWLRRRLAAGLKNLFSTGIIGNKDLGPEDLSVPRFDFPTSAEKVEHFMRWLYDETDRGVLEITVRSGNRVAARKEWQNIYVRSAYQRGLNDAYPKLVKAGYQAFELGSAAVTLPFNQPIHADALGLLYTRNFEDLKGITQAMGSKISSVLTQGLAEGRGLRDVARQLNKAVDEIGIRRARMLARTEIIRSHYEASLNAFQQAGVEGVDILAEVLTAGDGKVCAECGRLAAAGPYTIEQARGLIPAHPNCRCSAQPSFKDIPA